MVKYLPFIIPIVCAFFILIFGYFYIRTTDKPALSSPSSISTGPVEVPKTLPIPSPLPSPSPSPAAQPSDQTQTPSPLVESRLKALEAANLELKSRVAVLEKATAPTSQAASSSKAPLYIPIGASGGPWLYADWTSLNEYQVSVNPNDYSGYSSMQLEVNFRIIGAPGTGYVRLYNVTDKSVVASEISTTNTSFGVLASAAFKLTAGQKLYTIQAKSTSSQDLYIQSARIKVSF